MPRHPALRRLDALAGDWVVTIHAGEHELAGARTSAAWIEDGAFLALRADAAFDPATAPPGWIEHSPFPTKTVIGLDDHTGTYTCAYADARGVRRVYAMRLDDERWELEGRPGETFFQRFSATFADGGDRIDGRWEHSPDGVAWELDFAVVYTRA
ncbi:MAG TPA: hypothetical protein VF533_03675 [Solirubrobacteraceae bacterium]|jgi:hypothetical protein